MEKHELKYKYSEGSEMSKADIEAMRQRRMSSFTGKTASMSLCVFNLMNAILGSGILGLANAVVNLGIVLFTMMLVGVSGLAFNSIRYLLELCDYTGVSSYEALGRAAFGAKGKAFTVINIFTHTLGAMCSFLFIVKYELPEVIRVIIGAEECDMAWYLDGNILVILVTIIVIVPLASAKNIGFLGYTSGFAMACMIFFTGVIVAEYWVIPCPVRNNTISLEAATDVHGLAHNGTEEEGECASRTSDIFVELEHQLSIQTCDLKTFTWNSVSAYAIPTMIFAFQCHASVLPIKHKLQNPTQGRMKKVAVISIGNVFLLYFMSAFFGYLTFVSATGPELLLMYSEYNPTDPIILISRIMVLICVIFSTPLLHYPARKAIMEQFFEGQPFSWVRHLGIMAGILTTVNLLVIFVPTIRVVFGLAGATCASMLVIILPAVYYIRIAPGALSKPKKMVAMALAIIGVLFMIFSMVLIIMGMIKPGEDSPTGEPTAHP
jgi:amino acid permease